MQARSTEDLIQAIHGHKDEGFIIERTRICLRLYFDPAMPADERAKMIDLYARALRDLPKWAVSQAFDDWERTESKKPTPADIRHRAEARMKPVLEELEYRRKEERSRKESMQGGYRPPVDPEKAQKILDDVGLTMKRLNLMRRFPMANSFEEAEALDTPDPESRQGKHWSDGLPPDDPQWEALRKARAASYLIKTPLNGGGGE